jgi:small-conductance mechanosensitive channel
VWSVLSNFLCSFVLVILKPFHVGEEIELPTVNIKGRVVDVTPVYTVIEVSPGETAMIPNNMFFQAIFKRRVQPARRIGGELPQRAAS